MTKSIFEILDESNDKAYFTIIPNIILNHSTGDEQALYGQMKRFAGEKGKCFASLETLAKKLNWGEFKVRSNIKKILTRKWIIKAGTVRGKTRPVNAYKVVDLWKLNTNFYTKKIKVHSTVSSKKKKDRGSQHGKIGADSTVEEEPIIKKIQNTNDNDLSFPKLLKKYPNFDIFYSAYPRKVSGRLALKTFKNLKPNYKLLEIILEDIKYRKTTSAWKGDIEYIPHPSTYLNRKRWEDEDKGRPPVKPKPKPYFRGDPMVYSETRKQWYVITDGEWKKFVGKEEDIKYK